MENDATACFYQMIPFLVMLGLRANGIPEEIAQLTGKTLAKMRYRIKTKLGISHRHYGHSNDSPIYGTGQGSMGSMALWLLISTTLFAIMSKIAHGLQYSDPAGLDTLQQTMEGFVGNTDVAVTMMLQQMNHIPQPDYSTSYKPLRNTGNDYCLSLVGSSNSTNASSTFLSGNLTPTDNLASPQKINCHTNSC